MLARVAKEEKNELDARLQNIRTRYPVGIKELIHVIKYTIWQPCLRRYTSPMYKNEEDFCCQLPAVPKKTISCQCHL
jgi:hypothetical protein